LKKTFLEIKEADQVVANLFAKFPNLEKGKFGYSWKRFLDKNYTPTLKEFSQKIEDVRLENCLTDPTTKEILYDSKNSYKFSKEGRKNLMIVERELIKEYDSKEIEIIPYLASDVPELTEEEKEVLKGLITE